MEIIFILVEPAVEENIGSAARAIKTMGFQKLRLVNPKGNYLDEKAIILAHGSSDILENAEVFNDFESAIHDLDLVIATSARNRKTHADRIEGDRIPGLLENKTRFAKRIGMIFGCEESGLETDQLKKCDIISFIPIAEAYPSLNLAQAVMLYAYILSPLRTSKPQVKNPAIEDNIRNLKKKIELIFKLIKFTNKDVIGPRILERITFLDNDDLQLIQSICNALLLKSHIPK